MKRVADYTIDYIYRHGTDTIFTIAGGGAMFLNDAIAVHKKIKYICNHHEQASAMAAEAYAKMNHQTGVAIVTSGPGSTNAITGLLEAYQNSIPILIISSQAKESQMTAYSSGPKTASVVLTDNPWLALLSQNFQPAISTASGPLFQISSHSCVLVG